MPTPREAYTNSVQREGRTGARLRAADYGAAGETIGRAVQGFGQAVGQAGEAMAAIQQRDAETAAQEADNIRQARRLKRFYEGPEGYFNQEGRNAVTDQEKLTKDLEQIDREAGELLSKKPFARALYDKATLRRNSDDMPRIFQHANTQRNKYEEQVDADAFDVTIDTAASSGDPTVRESSIITAANLAEKQARRKGLDDPKTLQNAREAGVGKVVAAVAETMERRSADEAQQFINTNAHRMDPDDVNKLLRAVEGSASEERAGWTIGEEIVYIGGATSMEPPAAGGSSPPPAAGAGRTAHPPQAALAAAQWDQESGGVHRKANGELITSSAGARGISQTMVATGFSPGYGVKPLQNQTREEYIRFGNDYRNAMIKEFGGNVVLGLTAYNWGPGNLKAHIKKVGDPSKGQISDAAFLASIPVKEAREYAPLILNRVGVSVAGKPGPSAGQPVQVGREVDLDATINNIRNSDRSWIDKKALIAEATRLHGYGAQVKRESEEATKDAAWAEINKFQPGEFTNYNSLPLSLRQQLDRNPQLAVSFKNEAASNAAAKQNAQQSAEATDQRLNLADLRYGRPDEFLRMDIRTDPRASLLTTPQKLDLIAAQQAEIRSRQKPGDEKSVDHSRVRTAINRFAPDPKTRPANIGQAYDEAIRREEALIAAGKPVNDAVREGIAREVMTKHTLVSRGWIGRNETTVRAYELPAERERLGSNYRGSKVDSYEAIRSQLQQIWRRIPTDAEVQAEIANRTTKSGGLRL